MFLIILADIPAGFVEQVLVFDLILNVNHLAKGLLDLTFAGFGVLPARETYQPNYFIDVGDDTLR